MNVCFNEFDIFIVLPLTLNLHPAHQLSWAVAMETSGASERKAVRNSQVRWRVEMRCRVRGTEIWEQEGGQEGARGGGRGRRVVIRGGKPEDGRWGAIELMKMRWEVRWQRGRRRMKDDPAFFLIKIFPVWGQWDQLQIFLVAQVKTLPVASVTAHRSAALLLMTWIWLTLCH